MLANVAPKVRFPGILARTETKRMWQRHAAAVAGCASGESSVRGHVEDHVHVHSHVGEPESKQLQSLPTFLSVFGLNKPAGWPADRVLMGMMVCRELREALCHSPEVILRVRRVEWPPVALDMSRVLQRFSSRVSLLATRMDDWPNTTDSSQNQLNVVLQALREALMGRAALADETQASAGLPVLAPACSSSLANLRADEELEWTCDFKCGYKGIVGIVKAHESTCPMNPGVTGALGGGDSTETTAGTLVTQEHWRGPACLDFSSNLSLGSDANLSQLTEILPRCRLLTHLDLGFCNVLTPGCVSLAAALAACISLQQLTLSGNCVGNEGATALAKALFITSNLQHLHLQSSGIQSAGAEELAAALPLLPHLRHLDLTGNYIEAPGAASIASRLHRCARLESLELGDTGIEARGARFLALPTALGACPSLTSLGLSDNNISNEGAKALADILPRCTRLTSLNLTYNGIQESAAEALADVLTSCPSVTHLKLSFNVISAGLSARINDALEQSATQPHPTGVEARVARVALARINEHT